MSSLWFAFTTKTSESISTSTAVFSRIWWFFSWLAFFQGLFWNTGLYMYGCSFLKSGKYSSSEVPLSSILFFSSSKILFVSSDFDIFLIKLLSSKFVLSFLSLFDIWYKKALSTIVFLNAMTFMIRKRLTTFYFKSFFLKKMFSGDVWNYKK